jgi:tetratricopeptide (TPR) repeat protein
MIVKPKLNKILNFIFIVGTILGMLVLGRIGFVLGMSTYVNSQAEKGNVDPSELYYRIQAYTGDFMEPYKAYYNAGTAYAKNKDYPAAERFLTQSLAVVDYDYNECLIRNNLAITYEKLGDFYTKSKMVDTAESYYDKAVTTVQEAPLLCFPPPPPPSGGEGTPSEDGQPVPGDSADPDTSETGEELKETEDSSQGKGDEIRDGKGDEPDGEEQVEKELGQSTGETSNREDQQQQETNKTPEQVDQPW